MAACNFMVTWPFYDGFPRSLDIIITFHKVLSFWKIGIEWAFSQISALMDYLVPYLFKHIFNPGIRIISARKCLESTIPSLKRQGFCNASISTKSNCNKHALIYIRFISAPSTVGETQL